MHKADLQATPEMVETHVLEGDRLIAKQKELIAEMSALGVDVGRHRATLANFEEAQRLHIEHARQLKREWIRAFGLAGETPLEQDMGRSPGAREKRNSLR
jgi:hypothetical protein